MKALTFLELDYANAFDLSRHRNRGLHNYTRFYKVLRVVGQDIEVHTLAARARRNGEMAFKEVVRASVDRKKVCIKDLAIGIMSGYQVDWSPERVSRPRSWSYEGKWASEAYDPRSVKWKIRCRVVNPEVLHDSPRFRYCAWSEECGDVLDYLKNYVAHPRLELLSKAGAGRFCDRIGFVKSLEKDKGLLRFFMANLPEILAKWDKIDVIRLAYRRGIPLKEARDRVSDRNEFRKLNLPAFIDPSRAMRYIRRMKIGGAWGYCRYLDDCRKVGLDLKDTKVAFPRQFKVRRDAIREQAAALIRMERAKHDAELRKQMAEEARRRDLAVAKVAVRFSRLERIRTRTFVIQIPRKTAEFVREGQRLHNCLGEGYASKVARGETVLAWIRRAVSPAAAFVAVEYEPKTRKVLQCYGDNNSKPPAPVLAFVNRVFKPRKVAA